MAKVGRPRIVETPEEFEKRADAYFKECREAGYPVTITGLALALGYSSRQGFYDAENLPGFSDSVKRARTAVEGAYEGRLWENNPTGAIFALKNMGWSDRQQHELSGPGGTPIPTEVIIRHEVVDPGNPDDQS
jgi:hypothetical protein